MKKNIITIVILGVVLFSVFGCKKTEVTQVNTQITDKPKYIDIVACGDNLYHKTVIDSGLQNDGSYDYSMIYNEIQEIVEDADISIIGQETVFGGKEAGYSGYPMFNTPDEVGDALAECGYDIVLHATNHIMDKFSEGVERTWEFWENYPDITVLGIHPDEEHDEEIEIYENDGVKLALLNYTYDTNGIKLPDDKEYLVELIDEDNIESDAEYAEENADFTIAFMHWGIEYSTTPSEEQKELAEKMADWGVDLIIGSHPHVIEPVEWITTDKGNKVLVYYSLGNFVSRQTDIINLLGGMAKITLKSDKGEVSIDEYSFKPVVTHYNFGSSKFKIYPLSEYTDELASTHGLGATKEKFINLLDGVFDGYDKDIIEY